MRQKVTSKPQKTEEQKLDDEWAQVKAKAMLRGESDCPICFNALNYKKTVLLSCSHLFHGDCIANFEKFEREADQENYEGVGSH